MHENEEYITIDFKRLLYQIMHNSLMIIAVTLTCALLGYMLSAFLIKPTYSASAQMLVNNRRDEQGASTISQSDINASSSLVNTYSIILKSHDVLEKVINDCKLSYSVDDLSKKVSVSSVNATQVMKITVSSGDPQEALDICADLVELAPDAIISAMDSGSVTTVSSPYTTGKPVSPSKKRYTGIAGLLGLLACLAVILIQEITNDKFKTSEDIRSILDLNVLGIIPDEDSAPSQKKSKGVKKSRKKQ